MPKKKQLQKRKALRVKSETSNASGAKKIFFSSLFGVGIGFAFMFALIMLFSAIALSFDYPHGFLLPLSLFSIGAAAFFSGLFATRKNGGAALVCGILSGALLLLAVKVLLIVLRIPQGSSPLPLPTKLLSLGALPCAILGSFLGIPKSKSKSKHKG